MADWLARRHDALYIQSTQTFTYLEGHFGDFGIAGKSAETINTGIKPKYQTFASAYLAWQNPGERTPGKTAMLQNAERDFRPAYRELYNAYLKNNPDVTDNDLLEMGLPKRSTTKPAPAPVPTTVPEAEITLPSPGVVVIHYRNSGSKGYAKPAGVHGVEISWAVLPAMPVDWSALTNSAFDTRSPLQLAFGGEQRGQRLYFALRWENTRGEKGNWSEIYDAVIP